MDHYNNQLNLIFEEFGKKLNIFSIDNDIILIERVKDNLKYEIRKQIEKADKYLIL